jgi:hypothetical protein
LAQKFEIFFGNFHILGQKFLSSQQHFSQVNASEKIVLNTKFFKCKFRIHHNWYTFEARKCIQTNYQFFICDINREFKIFYLVVFE